MEKQSLAQDMGRDSDSRRSTSRHSGRQGSCERWEKGERMKRDGGGDLEEDRRRMRSKTAGRMGSRVEKFSFTENQWRQVEKKGFGPVERRSRTAGRVTLREKYDGGFDGFIRSITAGRELLKNRLKEGSHSAVGRSRTAGRLTLEERLGGELSSVRRSRTAGRYTLEERLGGELSPRVLPRPRFPKILARTTFVPESLPEAKNPGQDAFFQGLSLKVVIPDITVYLIDYRLLLLVKTNQCIRNKNYDNQIKYSWNYNIQTVR